MFASHALRESDSQVYIRCTYYAHRSARYCKNRLYCMHMQVQQYYNSQL